MIFSFSGNYFSYKQDPVRTWNQVMAELSQLKNDVEPTHEILVLIGLSYSIGEHLRPRVFAA